MNRELGSRALAAIVAAVIVVVGLLVWRVFGSHDVGSRQQQNAQTGMQQDYMQMRRMPPGSQSPPGMPSGGRP
jgi:hypothetical protein